MKGVVANRCSACCWKFCLQSLILNEKGALASFIFWLTGDAYFIVAGCPDKTTTHALKICDMAFDMMDGIAMLKDPGTGQDVQVCSQNESFQNILSMMM